MTLLEICEPLFQYVCRLNRLGRKGGRTDQAIVKSELRTIFADMRSRAEATPGMVGPYEHSEKVLMFFTDEMVLNGKVNFGGGWKPLSADPRQVGINEGAELAFEDKFWDLLDETLEDPTESAMHQLSVFYVCIGLGFAGRYEQEPETRKRKMLEISARLRGMIDVDQAARICAAAYDNVDTRPLHISPARRLTGIVIALTVFTLAMLGGYVYFFKDAQKRLEQALIDVSRVQDTGAK